MAQEDQHWTYCSDFSINNHQHGAQGKNIKSNHTLNSFLTSMHPIKCDMTFGKHLLKSRPGHFRRGIDPLHFNALLIHQIIANQPPRCLISGRNIPAENNQEGNSLPTFMAARLARKLPTNSC